MSHIIRKVFFCAALAASAAMVGCASPAPNYAPSIDNVEALKKSGAAPVGTGPITVAADLPGGTSLGLRGSSLVSSVGANYGDYVAAALRQELELAKLYDPKSGVQISGALLKNNINAGGISTADGQIEARFVVRANGQVKFDKIKRVDHQWESSFMGAVAIPAAANNYPVMVQKLIAALVKDPDFTAAIRK
ncbi:MAG: hypothetical protein KF796_06035 [Ramlibacter sp.]|nr:hypothetical protein [Ramlibacter sp.]